MTAIVAAWVATLGIPLGYVAVERTLTWWRRSGRALAGRVIHDPQFAPAVVVASGVLTMAEAGAGVTRHLAAALITGVLGLTLAMIMWTAMLVPKTGAPRHSLPVP